MGTDGAKVERCEGEKTYMRKEGSEKQTIISPLAVPVLASSESTGSSKKCNPELMVAPDTKNREH